MKLFVLSDVHLDHYVSCKNEIVYPIYDEVHSRVLIVAGDIASYESRYEAVKWLLKEVTKVDAFGFCAW